MAPTKPLIEYVYSQSGRSINARMNEAHLRSNGYEQVVDQLLETTADFADMTFTERLRMFVFDKIRVNHCKTCGTELRVWKKDDWKAFCSRSCAQNDPENKARMLAGQSTVDWTEKVKKREDTMQNTYGYTTYSKTEDAKKRFTERTKEAWSTPERKAQRIQRRIETNIGRYGREHTSQRPEQRIISGQAISKAYQEKSDGVKKEIIDKYRRTRLNSYVYDCLNNKTFLEEMCVDKRLSSLAISKILNCANSAVCYAIDRFNIPYDPIQQRSLLECELYEFVKSIYPAAIQSYRDIKEIDVFISECNFGFEFNGVYWHSEAKRHMTYHVEKINYFYDRDIHYVQIWEDDWLNKQDVVKTFIKKLLMPQMCIDLGETTIIDITYEDFSKFIDEYDLRGSEYADIMLALVDDDYNMLAAIGFLITHLTITLKLYDMPILVFLTLSSV